jgi:hypothetical protein
VEVIFIILKSISAMKQLSIIKKIILVYWCCLAVANLTYAQRAVDIVIGEVARQSNGDCGGSGRGCNASLSLAAVHNREVAGNAAKIFLTKDDRLTIQFLKASLSEELKTWNFEQKNIYFIENNTPLDPSLCRALGKESIILQKGMYPIIEWEDSYFVSIQLFSH